MKRRNFLRNTLRTSLAASLAPMATWAEPPRRPSFLVLTFEDISPRLGCYGDPVAKTPILDKLAERGYTFTNMMASSPVCAPARCTWITGVYPSALGAGHMRTEIKKPDQIVAFTQYLNDAGYYCCNYGKFDYQFKPSDKAWHMSNRHAHWKNRPDPDQPFYAVYNYVTTHQGRVQRDVLYEKAGGTLPESEKTDPADVRVPEFLPDTALSRELIARSYDNITFTEKELGKRIEELERTGVADRTIIIVTSDHGDGGLPRAKEYLYDSGLRVPFIMFVPPGIKIDGLPTPGSKIDRLCNFADFAPTVLSLAGVAVPDYMQGYVMLGNNADPEPEWVYATRDRANTRYDTMRALRGKRYLYIRHLKPYLPHYVRIRGFEHNPLMQQMRALHTEGKLTPAAAQFMQPTRPAEELFDTINDPDNVQNLADDPENTGLLEKLREKMRSEIARIGDTGFIPEGMLHSFREKVGSEYAVGQGEQGLYDPLEAFDWMTLGQMDGFDADRALQGLHSDDPVAQYWSAIATGYYARQASSEMETALAGLLDSEYGDIRAGVAFALLRLRLRKEKARATLLDVLQKEKNFWVRLNALNLLDDLDMDTFEMMRPLLERIDKWKIVNPMSDKRYVRELAQDLLELKGQNQ